MGKGQVINLVGQKFNRLSVQSFSHVDSQNRSWWDCLCDCGNIVKSRGDSIKSGHTKSCGCQKIESASMQSFIDMTGDRFGRLTVLRKTCFRGVRGRQVYWECICDCGNIKIISGNSLRSGLTRSCGCLQLESVWKGGKRPNEYPPEWGNKLRNFIRDLDGHRCQFPGCDYSDLEEHHKKLAVHHIDGHKKNCSTYNLISLCGNHHMFVEVNDPDSWIGCFHLITGGNLYE